jgi:hypothetical protein
MCDDSKEKDSLTNAIVSKYRSIIDAQWQSWGGFTGALFGESRDDRNFCRVTYHFDSSCKVLTCVDFAEGDGGMYWGAPIHRSELWIPCTNTTDIADLLNPVHYLKMVYKLQDEYDPDGSTELVIRAITPLKRVWEEVAIEVQAYWLFDPKDAKANKKSKN